MGYKIQSNLFYIVWNIWRLWKKSPWYPIFSFILQVMAVLFLFRAGFIIWKSDRVIDAGNPLLIILYGLRMDLILISVFSALPILIATIMNKEGLAGIIWQRAASIWFFLFAAFVFFMEIATPVFINQYDTRPNRLFVEYLEYPQEVFKMLVRGFGIEILAGLLSFTLMIFIFVKINKGIFSQRSSWSPGSRILIFPFVAVFIFMGARSSFSHRPANPSSVAFTSDSLVNSLSLSSGYSLIYAIYRMKDEKNASKMYGSVDKKTMLKNVRENAYAKSGFNNTGIPTLNSLVPLKTKEKPMNLVVIVEESLGAEFVGCLGGKNLTPNLDKLVKKGIFFNNLYATGTRSVRGLEAVITGFFPSPARSVVKLGKARKDFFTIASFLKKRGYKTRFVYGGTANFDNMASFFMGNGFDEIIEEKDYHKYKFKGSWGVSDEDLFDKTHGILSKEDKKPSFTLVFTSSNHTPFEFPDGRIKLSSFPKNTVENAVKYADYALGDFFKKAEKSSYYRKTVFLVVADHNSRVYGEELVPVSRFHIPALIFSPDIKPFVYEKVSSQTDLPVTLLSIMGFEGQTPMIGRNLMILDHSVPGRAVMQFNENQAYMEGRHVVVLRPGALYKQFEYRNGTLKEESINTDLLEKALSHAQWVSWTYDRKLYRIP